MFEIVFAVALLAQASQPQNPEPSATALHSEPLPPVAPGAQIVAAKPTAAPAANENAATPIDRSNFTITAWDLEMLVRPASFSLAVRAHVTVRNDATIARAIVPLQVSSSLHWQSASFAGTKLQMEVQSLDTDLDHTSRANEALIHLPNPLAPGASTTLDVFYEGAIPVDATRIEHLGAPRGMAQQTDWDRIAGDFTGLRGFGTVLWYPVIADPVSLGDGAKLFHAIGAWKQREQSATMRIRLRVDTSTMLDDLSRQAQGQAEVIPRVKPKVALLNAERFALKPGADGDLLEAELPATPVGFAVPSIFLLSQDEIAAPGLRMFPRATDANAAQGFVTALEQVRPLVAQWLGAQKRDLTLVAPPALQDAAFETQPASPPAANATSVLVTPMLAQDPQQNTPAMAHALAHASFFSPQAWLAEGVPQFLSSLWIGKSGDPAAALSALGEQRPALALAETADPAANPGEPLTGATDDIFLRVKSAYVLWMLREIVGDATLATALRKYDPTEDKQPQYFQRLVESASQKNLQTFFDDWIYRDRGLPDLQITNVISRKIEGSSTAWLVSVDIANQGYASADVPVVVHAGEHDDSQRALVPARGTVTVRIVLHTEPVSVTVNDGATPEVNASVHERQIQGLGNRD